MIKVQINVSVKQMLKKALLIYLDKRSMRGTKMYARRNPAIKGGYVWENISAKNAMIINNVIQNMFLLYFFIKKFILKPPVGSYIS